MNSYKTRDTVKNIFTEYLEKTIIAKHRSVLPYLRKSICRMTILMLTLCTG
jgi:hypothetical protein